MFTRCLLAGAALAALLPAVASAASAPASAGPNAAQVTEVVVTARKRVERLQDVPIAVTAIDSGMIEREQINQVKDIAAFSPGLIINSDSVSRSFVSIRGVGTTLIDTVQPGVGIFIDGIYQPNTSYLNTPLLDVEQVEVLRGPQGTLFGNNTLGGAINVITKQPSDQFHASLTGDYAGPDNYVTGAATVSGPLIRGVLQGRLAIAYHEQDGFEKNVLLHDTYADPLRQQSMHGTLRWEPASWATITTNAYYEQVRGATTPYVDVSGPKDYSENVTLNLNNVGVFAYSGANVKGEFNADSLNTKITTVLAYDSKRGTGQSDGDFGRYDFLRTLDASDTMKTSTGEVRFDTKWSDQVSTLIGVFADRSVAYGYSRTDVVPLGVAVPTEATSALTAQAIYGTLFWKVTPTIEATVGLRYDHQDVVATNTVSKYASDALEPRFTVTKHWTPDVMTYASVSRGFRGGGANGPGAPNPIYKGDSVWTYEAGSKFEALGRRLSVDWDVFYNDYSNYIGQNSLAPSTSGAGFVAVNLNSGTVQSYGTEVEARYRPTERWNFSAGGTLMHARITDGSEYVQTTGMPLPTDRLLFIPDWDMYATGAYTQPIGEDSLRFDATVVAKGDRVGSTFVPTNVPVLAPYALLNANITYTHGRYQLALFGTNLTDTRYIESYIDGSVLAKTGVPPFIVTDLAIPGDRRRVGVRLSYKY